jgi:hypothetical protein
MRKQTKQALSKEKINNSNVEKQKKNQVVATVILGV